MDHNDPYLDGLWLGSSSLNFKFRILDRELDNDLRWPDCLAVVFNVLRSGFVYVPVYYLEQSENSLIMAKNAKNSPFC